MKSKALWVVVVVVAFLVSLATVFLVQKYSIRLTTAPSQEKAAPGELTPQQRDAIVGQMAMSIAANSEKIARDLVAGLESSDIASDALKVVYDKAKMQAPAKSPSGGAPQEDVNKVYNVEIGKSYVKGPKDAPVTIVAFSDFECPFCSKGFQTEKEIEKAYPGKLRFVFKAKILDFHKNAKLAHKASCAAGDQGKFWEMYDLIFSNQKDLNEAAYIKYAEQLKLNANKFKADLQSDKYDQFLSDEGKQAESLGVSGTPTFFVNGRKLKGAKPFEAFKTVIDEELAKKGIK